MGSIIEEAENAKVKRSTYELVVEREFESG